MGKLPDQVIWITTDHMRWDCVGAHGFEVMHTPNLDALVGGGVSFSRCYANSPVCMPSRCSFMTGCYPQQTGVMTNGQELADDFEPTVAGAFKGGGMRTVQIGKLHFQCHEDHDLDPRARCAYGFDVFQVSEEPGCYEDAYRTWLRGEHPELVEAFTVARPASDERMKERDRFVVLDAPWEASHSGWVATQACRQLYTWGRHSRRNFVHLGLYAPHPPLNPTREMMEPYEGVALSPLLRDEGDKRDAARMSAETLQEYRRHFYAMVTGVDLAVGKLVAKLKEQGDLENTLLIFGSDHGDANGDHGDILKGPSYFEGIMRLPWIMHWPAGLGTQPRVVDGLVEMVDVLPTILELSGCPVPEAMQGRSYAKELLSRAPIEGREDVYAIFDQGDLMLRSESLKYLRFPKRDGQIVEHLYDLRVDPNEFVDVVDDPAYKGDLQAMRNRALTRSVEASRSIRPKRMRF